jgi:hypothetical protein
MSSVKLLQEFKALVRAWHQALTQAEIAGTGAAHFAVSIGFNCLWTQYMISGPVDRELMLNRLARIESPPELKERANTWPCCATLNFRVCAPKPEPPNGREPIAVGEDRM